MKQLTSILLLILVPLSLLAAPLKISSLFSDGMVIQRDMPVHVFGTGKVGGTVSVSFKANTSQVKVNKDGRWFVALPEVSVSKKPSKMIVSDGNETVTIKDVLVGDVWLCSGQSNMDRGVASFKNAEKDIASANHSAIRLFIVSKTASTTPLNDVKGEWKKCTPTSVKLFSAVGYYYGRKLYKNLDIPIGLIESASGGSNIETWIPLGLQMKEDPTVVAMMDQINATPYSAEAEDRKVAKANETWKVKMAEWTKNGKKGRKPRKSFKRGDPRLHRNCPGNLYNGMIFPMGQFPIKGVVWYQGETNAGKAHNYLHSLKLLTSSWRQLWKQKSLPVYFVQLPNHHGPWKLPAGRANWAAMREAVWQASKQISNTGLAVTIDLGEARDIHPQNKQDVGDRLGRVALHKTYGVDDLVWTGPIADSCQFKGGRVTVYFENGGAPLAVKGGGKLYGFALTGVDGRAIHAEAKITGSRSVVVSSPQIKKAVKIHYAWGDNPVGANLINEGNLPASSFRFTFKAQ